MSIPTAAIAAILSAGHPDHALVGVPVSLLREIFAVVPVAVVDAASIVDAKPPQEGPSK